MSRLTPVDISGGGKLALNVMHFARALRAAGMPVGPGKTLEAVQAAALVGLGPRHDFYWAMHAVFVERAAQRDVFDQAFRLFWRNPAELRRMMALTAPGAAPKEDQEKISRRVADALSPDNDVNPQDEQEVEVELDTSQTYSAMEILQEMDFESMSAEEVEEAKRVIAEMRLPIMQVPTRRFATDPRGARIDMRATLRAGLRSSGGMLPLKYRRPVTRHPPLVVLCDISGSMSRYSRMFLHFVHAITNDRDRVHSFIFGTRLTNITRQLQNRDVDVALDRVAQAALDWSGGTRIGESLHDFNRLWSRRVLGQGAVVLLITDGLDRGDISGLETEIVRLHQSCRRLIWLNPLLRFDGFRPEARGVKAIMPHVDDFRAVHSLSRLRDIGTALSQAEDSDWQALNVA
ncbi:MAG: VWA domain-containing protein [Rhodospirillaceae bacterium]|nr:VWA domain-containing protein [Rhodospirillaceae bacterium]MBT3928400.1 VWA domain-containing protein [Rhodospirillaceae bacterium]MBT4428764.1 VWA domain-containing protein [Rhodospirillaceae bacterium]MBT5777890.1 VWA domain-containing protein [Rhodospirillaceae bacterium]